MFDSAYLIVAINIKIPEHHRTPSAAVMKHIQSTDADDDYNPKS